MSEKFEFILNLEPVPLPEEPVFDEDGKRLVAKFTVQISPEDLEKLDRWAKQQDAAQTSTEDTLGPHPEMLLSAIRGRRAGREHVVDCEGCWARMQSLAAIFGGAAAAPASWANIGKPYRAEKPNGQPNRPRRRRQ